MNLRMTGVHFTMQLDEEQRAVLISAGRCASFPTIESLADGKRWIRAASFNSLTSEIDFVLAADADRPNPDPRVAAGLMEKHIELATSYLIYVAGHDRATQAEEAKGKVPLHAGDGFFLCNAKSPDGEDLGVSLHFLYDGERATKWFDGPAARLVRKLAVIGRNDDLRLFAAKHIELDPVTTKAPGTR